MGFRISDPAREKQGATVSSASRARCFPVATEQPFLGIEDDSLTAAGGRCHRGRCTKPRACAVVLGEEDEGKDAEFIGDHRKDGLRNSEFNHFKKY